MTDEEFEYLERTYKCPAGATISLGKACPVCGEGPSGVCLGDVSKLPDDYSEVTKMKGPVAQARIVLNLALKHAKEHSNFLTKEECEALEVTARNVMRLERLFTKSSRSVQ